jgi:hypothetical protein
VQRRLENFQKCIEIKICHGEQKNEREKERQAGGEERDENLNIL